MKRRLVDGHLMNGTFQNSSWIFGELMTLIYLISKLFFNLS